MIVVKEYKARLNAPSESNKYYKRTTEGGLNKCKYPLPNCVFYAWGRFYEILGYSHNLSRGNAEDWYGNKADGYKRGQTPKLGAIICWRKGETWNESDGAGHVAVVEVIKPNGDIVTSESVYGGERFRTRTYTKASGYALKNHVFQSFIYPPIEFTDKVYKKGDYRVTDASLLNVRTGPGIHYREKKHSEFTKNAQAQIYELVRYKADGYVMGVEFTVYEIENNWGRTPSGWVCLDYCTKI